MDKYIRKSVQDVRNLCVKNNWFSCGCNSQYDKMFDRVREHAEVDEVATMIWLCSEGVTKEEIAKQLASPELNTKRIEFVKARETIARAVNDENVFMDWLISGVADGDIKADTEDDELEYYTEDDTFAELMDTFLCLMSSAKKNGGLYFDNICSE